jgi:sRNA-binding protein
MSTLTLRRPPGAPPSPTKPTRGRKRLVIVQSPAAPKTKPNPPAAPDPQDAAAAEEWLRSLPCCAGPVRPLMIGTRQELFALRPNGITKKAIARALKHWCRAPEYLAAVAAEGSMRIDLRGEVAGPVSDEHRAFALTQLESKE